MLKRVKLICIDCLQCGLAQIDTTENVLLMICRCPDCQMKKNPEGMVTPYNEAKAAEGLAALFG